MTSRPSAALFRCTLRTGAFAGVARRAGRGARARARRAPRGCARGRRRRAARLRERGGGAAHRLSVGRRPCSRPRPTRRPPASSIRDRVRAADRRRRSCPAAGRSPARTPSPMLVRFRVPGRPGARLGGRSAAVRGDDGASAYVITFFREVTEQVIEADQVEALYLHAQQTTGAARRALPERARRARLLGPRPPLRARQRGARADQRAAGRGSRRPHVPARSCRSSPTTSR